MELCGTGIWKLLLGAVYKMVIAAGAYKVMGYLETGTAWYHWVGYAYAYGIYLFFDFAGYSLMAVGSSYVLGIETPDNFRHAVYQPRYPGVLGPLAHYAVALVPRFYLHAVRHVQLEEEMVFNAVAEGLRGIFR